MVDQLRSSGLNVTYVKKMEPIVDHLRVTGEPKDSIVFFGGDDLFELADSLHQHYEWG